MNQSQFEAIIRGLKACSKQQIWDFVLSRALWEYAERHDYDFPQTLEMVKVVRDQLLTN